MVRRSKLHNIVCGELKNTINAHGPITQELIGSAAKRITQQIRSNDMDIEALRDELEDLVNDLEDMEGYEVKEALTGFLERLA